MKMMDEVNNLLQWYNGNKRILPWREDPSPYHVWISEIMLQQTRVEAVKGYYARFLESLPDIASLAAADEDTYLKLWEGLGYYSRVRNLHKAAVVLMEDYGGQMPASAADLLKLPGIGPYTAAAISSIAFGEPAPAIDGNLLRVFARLTCYKDSILTPQARKDAAAYFTPRIQLAADTAVPKATDTAAPEAAANGPGAYNQALMDLGATICLPNASPLCEQCPLAAACQAHAEGRETELPNRPAKTKRTVEDMTVFLIRFKGGILLRKRPDTGLLASLYEFPNVPGHLKKADALHVVEEMGFGPLRIRKLPPAKHIFTHKEWHMAAWEVFADEWTAFDRTAPERRSPEEPVPQDTGAAADTKKEPADDGRLFIADIDSIEQVWSIPSAFAAYRDYLLGR
ncbi:MAG: A/G-specific adenine glycosylase [Firmicutes bacterium]|nr:A/G-specific adenine glycosylase [Bacillota bacterium]